MKSQRGFTLYELMVVVALTGTVGLAIGSATNRLWAENAASRAYCEDVRGIQRATRMLHSDLRNATDVAGLNWRRDGDRLVRGRREIARNVKAFGVSAEGGWATVRMVIGGRRHLPSGDGMELTFRVRMRNAGRVK